MGKITVINGKAYAVADIQRLIDEDENKKKALEVASRLTGRDMSRQTGRTTRIVDAAIQELFEKGEVTIIDHHPGVSASSFALAILMNRLKHEHPRLMFNKTGPATVKLKYFGI